MNKINILEGIIVVLYKQEQITKSQKTKFLKKCTELNKKLNDIDIEFEELEEVVNKYRELGDSQ